MRRVPSTKYLQKKCVFFSNFLVISWVHFFTFGLSFYIINGQKGIFECVCYIFCILQRVYKTRKFLVCPETFGLKLLVSFLVSFRYPFWRILDFLVSFRYPFWRILDFLVSFRYPETYFRLFPSHRVCAQCDWVLRSRRASG